jgi:hypothetical protein
MSVPVHDRVCAPLAKTSDHVRDTPVRPMRTPVAPDVARLLMLQRTAGNAAITTGLKLARARRSGDAKKELEKGLSGGGGGTTGAKKSKGTPEKSRKELKKEAQAQAKQRRHEKRREEAREEEQEELGVDPQQAARDVLEQAPHHLQGLLLKVRTVHVWLARGDEWDMEPEMRALVGCVTTMEVGEHGSRWQYLNDNEQRIEVLERIADLIGPLLSRLKSPGDYRSMLVVHGSYIFGPRRTAPGDIDIVDQDAALGDVDEKTGISGLTGEESLIRHPKSGNLTVGVKGGPIDLVGGVRILGTDSLLTLGPARFWRMSADSCWKLLNNAAKQDTEEKQIRWLMQAGFVLYHTLHCVHLANPTAAAKFVAASEKFRSRFKERLAVANQGLVRSAALPNDFDVLYRLLLAQYTRTRELFRAQKRDFPHPGEQTSSVQASGREDVSSSEGGEALPSLSAASSPASGSGGPLLELETKRGDDGT